MPTDTRWLRRLMAAFPVPAWDDDRVTGYVDAMDGAHDRHIHAALDRLIRGGWGRDFAPIAPTLRLLVDEIAKEETADRERAADHARRREATARVAGPWHALLWSAWYRLEHHQVITDELRPYADIVRRHNLTPEDGGCRQLPGPNHGLTTDPNAITDSYRQAVQEAEQAWRASGSTETAEQAALRALGGMTGGKRAA